MRRATRAPGGRQMQRFLPAVHRVAVVGTSTLLIAACSESTGSPTRAVAPDAASLSQSPSELNDDNGHGHVFHTREWFDNDASNNSKGHGGGGGGGGSSGTGIYYHGGPVLQAGTNVVAVYWASSPIFNNGPQ